MQALPVSYASAPLGNCASSWLLQGVAITCPTAGALLPAKGCKPDLWCSCCRVEYFGVKLEGFAFTENGWVQSYGSRYVRPPIIYGDVSRTGPITVKEFKYAQSLTQKPVKGMLTGAQPLVFPSTDCTWGQAHPTCCTLDHSSWKDLLTVAEIADTRSNAHCTVTEACADR